MKYKTKAQRKRRMCGGKVGHDSKEAAIVAIRKTRAENQKNGTVRAVALKAYLCHCGKWHIGHGKRLDWKYLEKIL